jgi:hypothetical protein
LFFYQSCLVHYFLPFILTCICLSARFFVWPWKSRVPHVTFVTSHRGHWPLLIRVSGVTWRGSKLLETLSFIRVT